MANPTYTPNYNLVKPDPNDFYDVNQFNSNVDIIDSELKKISDSAGNLTNLNTEQKANLVDAINELLAKIGNTTSLTTDEKSNLVAAVNEIKQQVIAHLAEDVHVTQEEREKWNQAESNAKAYVDQKISSGIDADKLDGKDATSFQNAIAVGSNSDPNSTTESYILTNHSNSPNSSIYWHIQTYFYSSKTGNRAQIAIPYNGSKDMLFVRHNYGGTWTEWKEIGGNAMEGYTKPRGEEVSIWGHLNEEMTYFDIQGEGILNSITAHRRSGIPQKFTLSVDGGTPFIFIDTENNIGNGGLVTSEHDWVSWIGTIYFKNSLVIKGTNIGDSNSTVTLNISYTMK